MSTHDAREDRQAQVWALHGQGLSNRVIAQQLGLHPTQVQRCIDRGRRAVRERQTDEEAASMAAWLTDQVKQELEASRTWAGQVETWEKPDAYSIATERKQRLTGLNMLARLHGVDPIRERALALREKQLTGDGSLKSRLEEVLGIEEAPPDGPCTPPPL